MCNEYRYKQTFHRLMHEFGQVAPELAWTAGRPNIEPRDSIRPTDPALVVIADDEGRADLRQLRWGFPRERGGPVINFRSDGRTFATGRCLIPADGFYEFTGDRAPKSKWLFTAADQDFFCIAGLVRDDRFTMLTMPPGPDIAPYHDRQIVILPRGHWARWLAAGEQPKFQLPPAGFLKVEQVR